ncbi:MAG: hypothetical protein AAB448_04300 [Patescibacteria group bacterium]
MLVEFLKSANTISNEPIPESLNDAFIHNTVVERQRVNEPCLRRLGLSNMLTARKNLNVPMVLKPT